jgi:hypothetical protein
LELLSIALILEPRIILKNQLKRIRIIGFKYEEMHRTSSSFPSCVHERTGVFN